MRTAISEVPLKVAVVNDLVEMQTWNNRKAVLEAHLILLRVPNIYANEGTFVLIKDRFGLLGVRDAD